MSIRIHLDTDIGGDIDDLCAMAMLLKRDDLEITGVTTTADDGGKRAGYARYVLKLAGRTEIPVAAGADVSSGDYRYRPRYPSDYPSEEVYWPEPIDPTPNPVADAIELLKRSIEQGALVVGIGPYTNLALLDRRYPGLLNRTKLFLMGGCIYPARAGFPSWGNDMDYNVQFDAASARHCIECLNPTLIPLTVTIETALRRAYLPRLEESGPVGRLIAGQARAFAEDWDNEGRYGRTCDEIPQDTINFQHDSLACAVAAGWDGARTELIPLELGTRAGWMCESVSKSGRPTSVVTEIDREAFNQFWLDTVTS